MRRSMKQFHRYWTHCMCMGGLVTVLVAGPLWGQKTQPPSQPTGPAPPTSGQPVGPSRPSSPQMQTPFFVNGRVLLDGQPVPEPVSVGLSCGVRTVQVIHTDLKGNF